MVTIEVDLSHVDKFGPKMPEIRRRGLTLTALDMQRTADRLSPVDEGLLHKWFIAEQSDSQAVIKSPAEKYVGFVNYGTGPIKPKHKKALHWGGEPGIFAKSTKGQKGQRFIDRAIKEVTPRIDQHFKTAISEVLK